MALTSPPSKSRGFTLIELMVVIAVIAVLAGIAIASYNGYIREARLSTAKLNADSLRLFLEDFQLDNATYKVGGLSTLTEQQILDNLGWSPDGDADVTNDEYTYSLTVTDSTYDILVEHFEGVWMRCDDRMTNCCSGDAQNTTGKTGCP